MCQPTYLLANEFKEFEKEFLETCLIRKRIEKGTIIYHQDDRRNFSYYIISGVAAFFIGHESGKDKLTTFRGEGTIFPLYYVNSRYNMENHLIVKAITDMEVIMIPKNQLKNMMLLNPRMAVAMSETYCKYCSILLYDLEGQLFETYVSRTCNFLYIYSKYMKNLHVRLNHEEIAQATGITRANVSRVISRLKKDEVIRNTREGFEIMDEDALLAMCSSDFS